MRINSGRTNFVDEQDFRGKKELELLFGTLLFSVSLSFSVLPPINYFSQNF
jgi:hypothetical protein